MTNYQIYVDEILDLILGNDCDNIRIKEISIEIQKNKGINGLLILSEMLSNQIGNDFIGSLYKIECIL